MHIGDWVYFSLLWTALVALPSAMRAVPVALRHWIDDHEDGRDAVASSGALLVSLGIMLHAAEEVAYKSGRIWQLMHGSNTYEGASGLLVFAGLLGIGSLTLAVHYLNRANPFWPRVYWTGQAVLLFYVVLT